MPSLAGSNWTVDMLDALPDDGQRYEIIDGELFVTPSPNRPHQRIAGAIFAELRAYLRGSPLAYPMISPSDVYRGERRKNRVQPDVFVVRRTADQRPEFPFAMSELVLAIEVQSPSNPRLDYQIKRDLYLREGVPEYWVVNGDARNVSVWRGVADPGEVLSRRVEWQPVGMTTPFVLDLDELFAEAYG
jgi:Uma2 family endonuclease